MDQKEMIKLYEKYLHSAGVSTDSRSIQEGQLFIALSGPNYNANQFASQALEKGASIAVVDDPDTVTSDRYFLVENTLQTLQELALYHRQQVHIPVIGITGSNGKTTTKELIREVLSAKYKVHCTKGNFNNHIGVPLTLLAMNPGSEIAIIEMGANHIGEIARLCSIARPSHGMITNIGTAHIEGFGSFEGVLRGKSELYDHLLKTSGTVMINSRDELLTSMGKRFQKAHFYPDKGDYYHCKLVNEDPFLSIQTEEGILIETNLIGKYNFINIAAALAWGKYFEVDPSLSSQKVADYIPADNRSQIIKRDTNMIILDAYNANPSSMQTALESFEAMEGKKVVILGDMNELGSISEQEHKKLVKQTVNPDFEKVLLCGKLIRDAATENPDALWFEDVSALNDYLKNLDITNHLVFIKASRSLELERVLEAFS